jgi:hypothetical protein
MDTEQKKEKKLSWFAIAFISFVIGLFVLIVVDPFRYGTLAATNRAWKGDVILSDRYEIAVDKFQLERAIRFQLTNISTKPIRFLGAQTPCTCVLVTGLPTSCEPKASIKLEIRLDPKKLKKTARIPVRVFTDLPSQQIVPLTITVNLE